MALSACMDRAADRCAAAFAAGPSAEAVRLCEEAAGKDPRSGAMAARMLADLRQGDRALAWVEKLRGTSAEPDAWNVAALVHLDRGEPGRAARSYRRALELFTAAGDSAGAGGAGGGDRGAVRLQESAAFGAILKDRWRIG